MAVIITLLSSSGGGSPPDLGLTTGEDFYLPTIYEAVAFTATFKFEVEDINPLTGLLEILPATTVTSDFNYAEYGITYVQDNAYTVTLSQPVLNAFPDQYYQFVLPDSTTAILDFNTEVPFYSLIKYQKPANNSVTFQYGFTVNESISATVNHPVVWAYTSAVANIEDIVSRGIK
jgi:hypothetical protein